jgi:hypothetical protein
MVYWTFREDDSPYRDAQRYTSENIDRLRAHVGDPEAPVHAIGGIGDTSTDADYAGFRAASTDGGALGISVYDWNTVAPEARAALATPSTC